MSAPPSVVPESPQASSPPNAKAAGAERGYRVGPTSQVCAGSGAALQPGQGIVTLLVDVYDASEPLLRLDFDREYWLREMEGSVKASERVKQGRVLAQWRSVVPDPGARRARLVDDDTLMDLFEQLVEASERVADDATRDAYAYMLALILLRRKRLAVDSGAGAPGAGDPHASGRAMFVRRKLPKSSVDEAPTPVIRVAVPTMSEQALIQKTDQLMRTLMGESTAATPADAGRSEKWTGGTP
jgi:hypothetical protein